MKLISKINELAVKYDIKLGLAVFILFINQVFAFIGGTVFFKNIFHVSYWVGFLMMALFYVIISFVLHYQN